MIKIFTMMVFWQRNVLTFDTLTTNFKLVVNVSKGNTSISITFIRLGEIVTSLYKISHTTYSDMPRGVIKASSRHDYC